jgi:hypothetical protein
MFVELVEIGPPELARGVSVEFEQQHYRQNDALQQPLPGELALH